MSSKDNNDSEFLNKIAEKWQERWRENKIFVARPINKQKFFITVAFPYPNSPFHIGHGRTYVTADVYARYKRMRGFNVLFPLGFHYTGTPILAMADDIAKGDPELLDIFINIYGIPKEDIRKLSTPMDMANYFKEDIKRISDRIGLSIDWTREFTTIDPHFSSFITWQFLTLQERGYIERGTHPVGWCPRDNFPVGMHDTKGDVEPEIGEFTVILFESHEGEVFPASTLRPETVYGAVNIWVNPEEEYVIAEVDNKKWILAKKAYEKLIYQKNTKLIGKIGKGINLVGRKAKNPLTEKDILILPSKYVDPALATGVVMSVPAHAPFDYIALKELKINNQLIKEVNPIAVVEVEGYGQFPAIEEVEKHKGEKDVEGIKKITEEVYRIEYHRGKIRKEILEVVPTNLKSFVKEEIIGKSVPEARENTIKLLNNIGKATSLFEILNKPVYCRCGSEVVVKILTDQWFIAYDNESWKKLTKKLLSKINVVPSEMRREFENSIDWLKKKACARTRGLGTKLPWDDKWIIESLSDSTIYMAYYTISHIIKKIDPAKLSKKFWDYVILGIGSPEELSNLIMIDKETLKELRSEFLYWYPLDSRHSGRDLIPNHLTFFLFNHAAIFPEELWPLQVFVNGFVLKDGKKMSKSLRNIVPLSRAINEYGVDTVRFVLVATSELLQDVDFNERYAKSVMNNILQFYNFVKDIHRKLSQVKGTKRITKTDFWLMSKMANNIEKITNSMENFKFRDAFSIALYQIQQDIKEYIERKEIQEEQINFDIIEKVINSWIRILTPIIPHICEQLWEELGYKGFVSITTWPTEEEFEKNEGIEFEFMYVKKLLEDINKILNVTSITPSNITIYISSRESYEKLLKALEFIENNLSLKDFINESVKQAVDKNQAAKTAQEIFKYATNLGEMEKQLILKNRFIDEMKILVENLTYIKKKLRIGNIEIYYSDDPSAPDKRGKKVTSLPLRPSIVIE
jgi:leucyl-tRNA synthetase